VELLSGGFFEPLLSSIPVRDARGQVKMMNDYLFRRFGFKPTGFWLTERVWDPCLPLTLAGTEMNYTVVDDTHFYYAGLKPNQIYGSYVTEKEGRTLSLLATPMIMRYLIPFKPVEDVVNHLREMEKDGRRVAVYGDDGEKFGVWPGTYEWVIKKGWLEKFFISIAESSDWLRPVLPGEFITSNLPLGRIYLPQASYEEMTEWALPAEQGLTLAEITDSLKANGRWEEWRPFVRGGVWDNFLVKYDEANRMHKKMLFLSEKIPRNGKAREFLWRGQCNCAYWHGVFGGLYLGHLRRAVHENLIRSQACVMEEAHKGLDIIRLDLDKDGTNEILLWSPKLSLGLDPVEGGGLFEICHLPSALNLSDTLTRRREAYHSRLNSFRREEHRNDEGIDSIHDLVQAKDEDLERSLVFDAYTRASLLDHFLEPQTTLKSYANNTYTELGDFVQGQYVVKQARVLSGEVLVELTRTGRVGPGALTVRKTVRTKEESRITVDYEFECGPPDPISALYGCEFNITLYSDKDQERYYLISESARRKISDTGHEKDLGRFDLVNGPDGIKTAFAFSPRVSAWFFPLITVSKSEEGLERTYQGSSLLFLHPLKLKPRQKAHLQIELELVEL
jgi:alpha-amylase